MHRRNFLRTFAGAAAAEPLARYQGMAAAEKGRTRIRDIKVMMVQGPRTYTYIKVETDASRESPRSTLSSSRAHQSAVSMLS
jgi:hypothetical protein